MSRAPSARVRKSNSFACSRYLLSTCKFPKTRIEHSWDTATARGRFEAHRRNKLLRALAASGADIDLLSHLSGTPGTSKPLHTALKYQLHATHTVRMHSPSLSESSVPVMCGACATSLVRCAAKSSRRGWSLRIKQLGSINANPKPPHGCSRTKTSLIPPKQQRTQRLVMIIIRSRATQATARYMTLEHLSHFTRASRRRYRDGRRFASPAHHNAISFESEP